MKIAGFNSNHDCSYCVLDDGKPESHYEYERHLRTKEPAGDSMKFFLENYEQYNEVKDFCHWEETSENWKLVNRYPESLKKIKKIAESNDGSYYEPGHHQSHAANAFFSSNFDEALIVTIDGGGRDNVDGEIIVSTITIWEGNGLEIKPLKYFPEDEINIGVMWSATTEKVYGLSVGYPKGNQCGTVMGMAALGNPDKYYTYFYDHRFRHPSLFYFDFDFFKNLVGKSEQEGFDVAAGLQKATEMVMKELLDPYLKSGKYKNVCFAGGVALNSVMMGKIATQWYKGVVDNFYVCPVPYDAGLSLGSAQYVWHQILKNPRIKWDDSFTPYMGGKYTKELVLDAISKSGEKVAYRQVDDVTVIDEMLQEKVVSVYGGASESGRRALGNRSILADPRSPNMKDIINDKVKHRQWFRPFAPSILREEVKNWFVDDLASPYMSFVLRFKEDKIDKVPAVVHFDKTARLQTVTEKDNPWYYNFIKKWHEKSGVPIVLNTSFNDREPIVETPEDAINCFLKTKIDCLYFYDYNILVEKV